MGWVGVWVVGGGGGVDKQAGAEWPLCESSRVGWGGDGDGGGRMG